MKLRKTTMYLRQMGVMLALIVFCISLLGAGFLSLSYHYNKNQVQEAIQRDINSISQYANALVSQGMPLFSDQFRRYLSSRATITSATVLLCQSDGCIVYAAGDALPKDRSVVGDFVPSWAVGELLTDKSYSGTTTLNSILTTESFVSGVPIIPVTLNPITGETIAMGDPTGILFIASDASSMLAFLRNSFQLFFLTAVAVLLISLVICSITVQRLVDPLKVMSRSAYQFAHGEVDTRVTQYANRTDEIGELAAAFNAMADSLAQAERQRSEFVANVSHELKTPMTTIAGFAEGILDGTIPPDKERESLQVISSETRRLSRLVRRMLDLSRMQSDQRISAQEQFDAVELLLRVLVSLEQKITEKELDVETTLPDGPVMVWGDPDAVTQVCYNLLDNAVKFSTPGGRLSLKITTRAGKAYVSIGNQGETIPPQQLSYIFDRFHKADTSRSSHKEGVGLGLYIVKTLLNAYKEEITATSENGYTEFTFTLSEV